MDLVAGVLFWALVLIGGAVGAVFGAMIPGALVGVAVFFLVGFVGWVMDADRPPAVPVEYEDADA